MLSKLMRTNYSKIEGETIRIVKSPNNTSWCFLLCPGLPFLRIFCIGNSDGFLAYLRWSFLHRSMVEPWGCSMPSLPEASCKWPQSYKSATDVQHIPHDSNLYSLLQFRYSSKHLLASKASQFKSWARSLTRLAVGVQVMLSTKITKSLP